MKQVLKRLASLCIAATLCGQIIGCDNADATGAPTALPQKSPGGAPMRGTPSGTGFPTGDALHGGAGGSGLTGGGGIPSSQPTSLTGHTGQDGTSWTTSRSKDDANTPLETPPANSKEFKLPTPDAH